MAADLVITALNVLQTLDVAKCGVDLVSITQTYAVYQTTTGTAEKLVLKCNPVIRFASV